MPPLCANNTIAAGAIPGAAADVEANMSGEAVDFDYLEGFAAGDMTVVTEVLALFQGQAEAWLARIDNPPEGWRDLAHTIKGAARGIGATALGDVADRAEHGDASLRPELTAALRDALGAIEGYLARVGGG